MYWGEGLDAGDFLKIGDWRGQLVVIRLLSWEVVLAVWIQMVQDFLIFHALSVATIARVF